MPLSPHVPSTLPQTMSKGLLLRLEMMIPPLRSSFHKGQLGRIGVMGGCEDYTGAPYFSAMASAKLGCDMSHVITTPGAAPVIKGYSPNLMVHPYLYPLEKSRPSSPNSPSNQNSQSQSQSQSKSPSVPPLPTSHPMSSFLDRLHVLVIGPGLGRDESALELCAAVFAEARKRKMPVVLDADGLLLPIKYPGLVDGYKELIMTPNVVEFERLAKSRGLDGLNIRDILGVFLLDNRKQLEEERKKKMEEERKKKEKEKKEGKKDESSTAGDAAAATVTPAQARKRKLEEISPEQSTYLLARAFGGVTIVAKGQQDYISNGRYTLICNHEGAPKRCGGQGDTLTGCIATLLGYRKAYLDGMWKEQKEYLIEDRKRGWEWVNEMEPFKVRLREKDREQEKEYMMQKRAAELAAQRNRSRGAGGAAATTTAAAAAATGKNGDPEPKDQKQEQQQQQQQQQNTQAQRPQRPQRDPLDEEIENQPDTPVDFLDAIFSDFDVTSANNPAVRAKLRHKGLFNSRRGLFDSDDDDSSDDSDYDELDALDALSTRKLEPAEALLLAAWGGCTLTRESARMAFASEGRSLQASDLTKEVFHSFMRLMGRKDKVLLGLEHAPGCASAYL